MDRLKEIRRLKARLNAVGGSNLLKVPDTWQDFARLTKIRSGAGFVNFNPYDYQAKLVDLIRKQFTTVIVKTRQLGISETLISYFIYECLATPGTSCVVFSMNQQSTSNLAKRARLMVESIPQYAKLVTDSLQILSFSNGSTIFFRNSTINGARGLESIKYVLFDEAEFVPDIGEIYKAVMPCTSMLGSDARIIINSTPGKQSGWYFDKLMSNNGDRDILQLSEEIKAGRLSSQLFVDSVGWGKAIIHWHDHPIYSKADDYLLEVKDRFQLDEATVQREYNLSFTDSSEAVFSPNLVRETCTGEITRTVNKNADYYIGVDPASMGKDYFVAIVLQELDDKLTVVDMYRKRSETSEYSLFQLGDLVDRYNPVRVAIETNAMGQVILEQLQLDRPDTRIEGIKTTAQSKPAMIGRLLMAMEDRSLTLPDKDIFIQEFLSFQRVGEKMEAVGKSHDDLVMASAFAVMASGYSGRKLTKFKFKESNINISI